MCLGNMPLWEGVFKSQRNQKKALWPDCQEPQVIVKVQILAGSQQCPHVANNK